MLLLTDMGEIYSWGKNEGGQLGIGTTDEDYHNPTKIEFSFGIPIRYISAGDYHSAAIDFDYNIYLWGYNNYGQLGLGNNENRHSPSIIKYLAEKKVEKIYCANCNTYALTQNGEVYSWGINSYGILGIEKNNYANIPTKLIFPDNAIIKKLYIGEHRVFAIDTNSKIYSWGRSDYHESCFNYGEYQCSPTIDNMLDYLNVSKIIILYSSIIILDEDKLYSVGYGTRGELGLDIMYTKDISRIKIEGGVEKIWGNDFTVFCKMMNGDLYAWGLNYEGQLGIGNKIDQYIPVKINIMPNIKSINYKSGTAYAIANNGEIYTWGFNRLVSEESILEPTLFAYFLDNNIEIKYMNRIKSARKN